jgi:regulator of protease activity HflC (stomatin/prohibitin superfamily)
MDQYRSTLSRRSLAGIGIGIVILIVAFRTFTVIPAGHVGVVDLFGRVPSMTLKPGINFRNPLANIHKFSVKTQEMKEVMTVPSKEGLSVQLEVSVLFHLDPDKTAEVYKSIGPDYKGIILEPNFRSITRGVTATYDARALYTSEREQLAQQIQVLLEATVGPRGIAIEATPLRQVGLPPKLTAAIEEKLQAEQESQRMEFVLRKEGFEADRKRIEARGIADFQKIVSEGLTPQFLRWKGIEATEKLAASPNAKTVVIGSGKDGLPLILGGSN